MNQEYEKAIEFANYQHTLSTKIKRLEEQISAKLTLGHNGGLFKIDQTLICFVDLLLSKNRKERVVLLDSNNKPILIENVVSFQEEILDRYFTSTNEFFDEFEDLKKQRTVEKLADD